MPFAEYILLALLGSTGAAAPGVTPSSPSIRTLDADAIAQPSGGAAGEGYFNAGIGLLEQATGGSTDKGAGTGRKGRHPQSARRSHRAARRHHRTSHTSGKRQH